MAKKRLSLLFLSFHSRHKKPTLHSAGF